MTIASGTRLGPYEITDRIGAGGMGEVWRGKDTRLDRTVAIKILPNHLEANTTFKERFVREAKTISQLNHPHICVLHDVGEAFVGGDGRATGAPLQQSVQFLVMEYLEGESLADRIRRGPLPLDEVLRYGVQIASALAAAHRQGIIHRDLKPGNVMLTKSGAKLLDFGLAKSGVFAVSTEGATAHKPLTQEGTILGTFQYMAPEQLEGLDSDARTDIFALGCVLYEMATGKRAFDGTSKTSLIAAIVSSQPQPISAVQPMTPPALEHVVRKCLEKQPDNRWQSTQDIASELQWIGEAGSQAGIAAPVTRLRKSREKLGWIAAALGLVVAATSLWLQSKSSSAEERRRPIRSSIVAEDGRPYAYSINSQGPVVSPDGTKIVFVARGSEGSDVLFVRSLDGLQAQPLAGTDGASYPFWSPDSRFIAFFAGAKLKKIDANGGPALTLATSRNGRGGTWNADNVIVFAPDTSGPLYRVSSEGGDVSPVTEVSSERGETTHRWPSFLPDGKRFLYLEAAGTSGLKDETNAIWAGSLDPSETRKRILIGMTRAMYRDGYLLFVRDSYLLAQRFDAKRLEFNGEPLPLAEKVRQRVDVLGSAHFSASETGLLLYQGGAAVNLNLVWVNREGKEESIIAHPAVYARIRLSPDGKRVVCAIVDPAAGTSDIWIVDAERSMTRRITSDAAHEVSPLFSPDGSKIVFGANRASMGQLIIKSVSGGTAEQILLDSKAAKEPEDWSPDGRYIVFNQAGVKFDFWALPLFGDRKPFPVVEGPAEEGWGRFSPDGKWIVYLSNETGNYEAFAMRFPPDGSGAKWQLTSTGVEWILGWSRDGREIQFLDTSGNLAVLPITLGAEIEAGTPRVLFKTNFNLTWDAAADGSRFLLGREPAGLAEFPATMIVDWPAALKR